MNFKEYSRMTNFRQVQGNKRRAGNIKEGHGPGRRQTKAQAQVDEKRWTDAGFTYRWTRNAPRLIYTWQGDFPTIEVNPGVANDQVGMVARYSEADFEMCFPYGTLPGDIAARLDDIIFDIMQAQPDDILDWQPANEEIDIDDFMSGRWVRS
jgi:hypothetical protein